MPTHSHTHTHTPFHLSQDISAPSCAQSCKCNITFHTAWRILGSTTRTMFTRNPYTTSVPHRHWSTLQRCRILDSTSHAAWRHPHLFWRPLPSCLSHHHLRHSSRSPGAFPSVHPHRRLGSEFAKPSPPRPATISLSTEPAHTRSPRTTRKL